MLSDKQKKHILVNRDGLKYYTVEGLEKVHEEMLRLLLIIDTIAKENNIPYWIDGGSLIGIVRHKGFIPWDDDLDIGMMRTRSSSHGINPAWRTAPRSVPHSA